MPWHAIYTKSRREKKVHTLLLNNNVESYCPLNKVTKQWKDRKKVTEVPLFTSYVFVNIQPKQAQQVRETDGVVNFVYWLGKPAIIRDDEMQNLKDFVEHHDNIKVLPIAYKKGDLFTIENGAFIGKKASITRVNKNSLELVLESMQLRLVVHFN